MYPALATRGFNLPVATGVIGSLAVPRSGLARASLSRLVSWIELWVCPSACKIPLLARLRRNAARSRFHRAWLARRTNYAHLWVGELRFAGPNTRLCRAWLKGELNQTSACACSGPGSGRPGSVRGTARSGVCEVPITPYMAHHVFYEAIHTIWLHWCWPDREVVAASVSIYSILVFGCSNFIALHVVISIL
jgi:hypothetical protein